MTCPTPDNCNVGVGVGVGRAPQGGGGCFNNEYLTISDGILKVGWCIGGNGKHLYWSEAAYQLMCSDTAYDSCNQQHSSAGQSEPLLTMQSGRYSSCECLASDALHS